MYVYIASEPQARQARVEALQKEVAELEEQLGKDQNPDKILSKHITLLHKYNESKDAAQLLIGKLATLKGTTVRKIHEDYDLKDSD